MSNAFLALIWWVIPIAGFIGALIYVIWVSKFKRRFESETTRSMDKFQRFQDSFRVKENPPENEGQITPSPDDVNKTS